MALFNGQEMREFRDARGYSLQELGQKSGLSTSYLSEIERGCKKPSFKTVRKIAETLYISPERLLDRDPSRGINAGEKIRVIREDKKISLKALAENAGISVSYLSEIERGRVAPAIETLRHLAKALETPVSSLVGRGGSLGQKLRQVRQEQGLTQTELARGAGLSPGLIGQIEQEKVQPSLQSIEKIADVLGVSPCFFITEDASLEDMLRMFTPEARKLFAQREVQAVLSMLCGCSEAELRFILDFIKLYKTRGN